MNIRKARHTDEAEWLRMRVALWPDHPVAELRRELTEIRGRPEKCPVFVVERPDGTLGGFLEANIRSDADGCQAGRIGYIEGWYVDPDLRRQGWGKKLVEAAEGWASDAGCREMASDCDLENALSFKAHMALGYEEHNRVVQFKKRLRASE